MKVAFAAGAILLASLALRAAVPIAAIANAAHDDALFVKLAAHIAAGDWLGPYDNLTHAKGAAFPAFIALVSFTGVSLKVAEHAVYLSGCVAFAWVAARLLRSKVAGLTCLAVLAFNPVAWSAVAGGRVVREGLYAALSLWIVALAAHAFLGRDAPPRWGSLAALGFVGGLFWLTREEGAWLAPSLALIVLAWLLGQWRELREGRAAWAWQPRLAQLGVPAFAFATVVVAVDLANYVHYGVFRNNDFRSRDFVQAYAALSRIAHESPRPYVLFPADARQKAYAASPAARELAPAFEGVVGENWRAVGCQQTGTQPCPEILAGWFMWALRDAVALAGHYGSARDARSYYRRLAREVNAACESGALRCGPRSDSLVPPWRPEYAARIVEETLDVVKALATLGNMTVRLLPSVGNERERLFFARMTNDRQAHPDDLNRLDPGLMTVAEGIARAQVAAMPWLFAAAFVASLGTAIAAWRQRRWHPGLVLLAALWVAVAMRVGLLGFLAATSIPANHLLYLTPVFPMALVLIPFSLFQALDLRRAREPAAMLGAVELER